MHKNGLRDLNRFIAGSASFDVYWSDIRVLAALMCFRNQDGRAQCSIADISSITPSKSSPEGMNHGQVFRSLKRLKKIGVVEWTKSAGGRGKTNKYIVRAPAVPPAVRAQQAERTHNPALRLASQSEPLFRAIAAHVGVVPLPAEPENEFIDRAREKGAKFP